MINRYGFNSEGADAARERLAAFRQKQVCAHERRYLGSRMLACTAEQRSVMRVGC